jgi:hypothetical protein
MPAGRSWSVVPVAQRVGNASQLNLFTDALGSRLRHRRRRDDHAEQAVQVCRLYQAHKHTGQDAKILASDGAGCFLVGLAGGPEAAVPAGILRGGAGAVGGLIDAWL